MYIHTHTYTYIHIHTYTYIHTHTYTYIYINNINVIEQCIQLALVTRLSLKV